MRNTIVVSLAALCSTVRGSAFRGTKDEMIMDHNVPFAANANFISFQGHESLENPLLENDAAIGITEKQPEYSEDKTKKETKNRRGDTRHYTQIAISDSIPVISDAEVSFNEEKKYNKDEKSKVTTDRGWDTEFNSDQEVTDEKRSQIRYAGLVARLSGIVGDEAYLHNLTTPQGKAFYWLAYEDNRHIAEDEQGVEQRFALASLFFAFNGQNWKQEKLHWLSSVHECQWHKNIANHVFGITNCNEDKEVTAIDLGNQRMVGTIPREIGLLRQLKELHLSHNRIYGYLPDEMGNLEQLESLELNDNDLEGTIPLAFKAMEGLKHLHLEFNYMHGIVPKEVCHLVDRGVLADLQADCVEDYGNMICKCCTMCCDGLSHCRFSHN